MNLVTVMRYSDKQAVFYTCLAIFMVIIGIVRQIESFLYGAVLVTLVSFYWIHRDMIIKKFRKRNLV